MIPELNPIRELRLQVLLYGFHPISLGDSVQNVPLNLDKALAVRRFFDRKLGCPLLLLLVLLVANGGAAKPCRRLAFIKNGIFKGFLDASCLAGRNRARAGAPRRAGRGEGAYLCPTYGQSRPARVMQTG